MLTILWIAGIISGFAFPLFLISAVRAKDEENEVPTYIFCDNRLFLIFSDLFDFSAQIKARFLDE